MTITPSDISPWEGTPVPGSRFTAQQHRVMQGERPSWTEFSEHIVVLSYPSVLSWGPPTLVDAPCPIIAMTRDGTRRLIITPAGDKLWVNALQKKRMTE